MSTLVRRWRGSALAHLRDARKEAVAVVRAEGEHVPPRRLPADRLGTGRFEGGGTTESCTLTRDIIRVSKQTYLYRNDPSVRGHTYQYKYTH